MTRALQTFAMSQACIRGDAVS